MQAAAADYSRSIRHGEPDGGSACSVADPRASALGPIAGPFTRHGGAVTAEDAALLMRRHCEQPVSQMARWIVGSNIVHFDITGQTWVPLFQFYLDDMSIRPEISAILAELSPIMSDDELAHWFVAGNAWLVGASPLETMDADFSAVLKAARADRFVITG